MKTIFAVGATALVCSSGAFAVGQAVTPGQFNALKARVARVEQRVGQAQTAANQAATSAAQLRQCHQQALPVTRFNGYLFSDGSNIFSADHVFVTTGLDVTGAGRTPDLYLDIVDRSCITATNVFHAEAVAR